MNIYFNVFPEKYTCIKKYVDESVVCDIRLCANFEQLSPQFNTTVYK